MKEQNLILEKSFQFSLRIVKLFQHLMSSKVEKVLCVQVLKSGTSIGANVEEAMGGASKKDFINKLQIAYREARETRYWIRVLKESELLENKLANSFIKHCEELLKILAAIINSSKNNNS